MKMRQKVETARARRGDRTLDDPSPGIFSDQDQDLRSSFLQRLERDRAEILRLREALIGDASPGELTVVELRHCAHQLYGTAAAFGMKRLSAAAGALQSALNGMGTSSSGAPSRDRVILPAIAALIAALNRSLES